MDVGVVSARRERRLRLALGLNVGIVGFQVVLGIAAGSLGLLADAGHNLADVAAIAVSLGAVRLARRPATESRSFGYHRGTILAAQANAAGILAVCVVVTIEAVRRLLDPQPVEGGLVVVAALIALAANLVAAAAMREKAAPLSDHDHDHDHDDGHDADHDDEDLGSHPHVHDHTYGHHHDHHRDLNMHSAWLHAIGDAAASAAVVVAGAVILAADGWYWLDPVASLLITVLIGVQGWQLLRETSDVLLESTPRGLDVPTLAAAIEGVDGVEAVHDLHVWTLSSDVRALSAHVVLDGHPTLEEAQVVGERVKIAIGGPFHIAHATLELECEPCADPPDCLGPDALSPNRAPGAGR